MDKNCISTLTARGEAYKRVWAAEQTCPHWDWSGVPAATRGACCEELEAAEVDLRRIIHAEQQKVRESLTPTE